MLNNLKIYTEKAQREDIIKQVGFYHAIEVESAYEPEIISWDSGDDMKLAIISRFSAKLGTAPVTDYCHIVVKMKQMGDISEIIRDLLERTIHYMNINLERLFINVIFDDCYDIGIKTIVSEAERIRRRVLITYNCDSACVLKLLKEHNEAVIPMFCDRPNRILKRVNNQNVMSKRSGYMGLLELCFCRGFSNDLQATFIEYDGEYIGMVLHNNKNKGLATGMLTGFPACFLGSFCMVSSWYSVYNENTGFTFADGLFYNPLERDSNKFNSYKVFSRNKDNVRVI